MCNHYRNDPEAIEEIQTWKVHIGWSLGDELPETASDVYPKRQGMIVRQEGDRKIVDAMHWGFPWVRKGKRDGTTKKMNTTNVRNLASPLFRGIIDQPEQRCLVPFNQFAEPKPNAGREEVWFKVNEQPVSCFAGIWRKQDEGKCYAFLTCEPNPLVKAIHPKAMPVILQPADYDSWLAGDDATEFQVPFPSQLMSIVG